MHLSTTTDKGTTYRSIIKQIAGNSWRIMLAIGKYNYVNVEKITNNPFKCGGKYFANFDEAQQNYKNPEMKTALLLIEAEFNKTINSTKCK